MKKKSIMITTFCIVVLTLIIFTGIIVITGNLKNSLQEISEVTVVDVTGIIEGKETQHEHIYKTMYDENKHWEECKSCGEKRNEKVHSFTTTWAAGYESCGGTNSYTKVCTCGYLEMGHKPCVWDGETYYVNNYWHARSCSVCKEQIKHSYYMYSYGNGKIYDATVTGQYIDPNFKFNEYCHSSTGTILNCKSFGECVVCKTNYTGVQHLLYAEPDTGKIYCVFCNQNFGTYSESITTNNTAPITYTIVGKFRLTNGAYLYTKNDSGYIEYTGEPWQSQSQIVNEVDSTWQNFTVTTTGTFKSSWKEKYSGWVYT